jgi:hypothetical protein
VLYLVVANKIRPNFKVNIMNTSTKQTENLAKCSDKSKPLLAVTCQLTERGTKNRDKVMMIG